MKPETTASLLNLSTSNETVFGSVTTIDTTFSTFISTTLPTIINTTDDFMEKQTEEEEEEEANTIVPIDFNDNSTTLSSIINQNTVDRTIEKENKTTVSILTVTSEEVMLNCFLLYMLSLLFPHNNHLFYLHI